MKIGIISDTHDHHAAITSALSAFAARGVELLIHCGDIQSPETVRLFQPIPTHFVLGNCDWRVDEFPGAIRDIGGVYYDRYGELELEGMRLAWTHSHDMQLFLDLEFGDRFDYLFYGHTHKAEQRRRGRTLVVNPGAMVRVRQRTCVVLELPSGEIESMDV